MGVHREELGLGLRLDAGRTEGQRNPEGPWI